LSITNITYFEEKEYVNFLHQASFKNKFYGISKSLARIAAESFLKSGPIVFLAGTATKGSSCQPIKNKGLDEKTCSRKPD